MIPRGLIDAVDARAGRRWTTESYLSTSTSAGATPAASAPEASTAD